ncbi:MAG: alpha/beta-type small acid-soluble spore protein [Alicyclobacillaceae bacterium]|nr:alpha/beta-type small acid-soluble spore protein [Alicyclobacillaceae bacterium]
MARRRRSLLVPEARPALEKLKQQVLQEKYGASSGLAAGSVTAGGLVSGRVGRSESPAPFRPLAAIQPSEPLAPPGPSRPPAGVAAAPANADRGSLTARQAGKLGGEIGGTMVKRLIAMAEQQLAQTQQAVHNPDHRPSPGCP